MEIAVEDGSIKHLDELDKIERECFGTEAFTKRQIAQLLTDYNSVSLIARVNGTIVGYVVGTIDVNRNSLNGHILTIDVLPSWRRKGIGARLLQEIEKVFKSKGVRTSHLEVKEDNVAAISLYEKFGYCEIGRLEKYYGKVHGLYLRKVLR